MTDQNQPVRSNILEQIRQICREFRKQISYGKSPQIEKCLSKVSEEGREDLFSNLLDIEISFRRSQGESPTSNEYTKRYPQFQKQVRRAFFEPSMGSVDEDGSTDGDGHTESFRSPENRADAFAPTHELPDANRLGDYELIRELGRGGMGVVYEARHTKSGNRVALKTLPTGGDGQQVNADRLYRFRREFRTLSEINHPNLVGMQSLEVDGSQWFFTMDLIDGEDFLSYVRPDGELDESRLRSCLSQLAEGVIALHRRGIIHRDLKPSNVLVSNEGRVSVLDFGLAAELQTATDMTQTRSGMFAGTPRYAAPEQMFGERTEASDWYAFGTMIYEALTGQPPFHGKDQVAVLRQKQEQDPPKLIDRDDLPADLIDLADGLVRREPNARLKAESIGERLMLNQETRTSGSAQGSQDSAGSAEADDAETGDFEDEEVVLIGREEQLAQLEAVKQEFLEKRKPQVVWITGKSGEGKSSLVERFLQPIRHETEMLVLSGRCYDRESVPFKVIDCWMDSLVSFLRRCPKDELKQVITEELSWLVQIFPVLKRVEEIASLPVIESVLTQPQNLRQLAFGALRGLLLRISRQTPIVIFVDDLQWGDADSLFAMRRILEVPDAPAVIFLGSYRSEEASRSLFLRAWQSTSVSTDPRRIEVGPLTLVQSLDLFARLLPNATPGAEVEIHRAFHESQGNAFFLTQLMESFDRELGTFQSIPLQELVSRRLSRLPVAARSILEMLSVFGQSIRAEEVGSLAGFPATPYDLLTRMRNEMLIRWLGGDQDQVIDTYHDQIRETIVAGLPHDERQNWQGRIAESLKQLSGATEASCTQYPLYDKYGQQTSSPRIDRLFDLAFHLYEAGDPNSIHYLILAGDEGLRTFSNDEAARHFERAKSLLIDETTGEIRFRVFSGLALAKLRQKNSSEAIELSQLAMQFASTDMDRILVLLTQAIGNGDLGQLSQAIQLSDQALIALRRPRPQSGLRKLFRILSGLFKGWAMPNLNLFSNEMSREVSAKEHEIYSAMTLVHSAKSNFFSIFDSIVAANIAAFRSEVPELEALGHTGTYLAFGVNGFERLARKPLARYRRMSVIFSSPQLLGKAKWDLALGAYASANMPDFRTHLTSLISATEQSGDVLTGTLARHFFRHVHAWTDSCQMELNSAVEELTFAEENKNVLGTFWGNYACADALARAGRLREAATYIQHAWTCGNKEVGSGTASCHCTEAFVMLQSSEYQMAAKSCQHSWSWIRENLLIMDYMVRSLPLWMEAILGPRWTDQYPSDSRKELKYISRWMWLLYRNLKTLQPLMHRCWGRLAASRGRQIKAIRQFAKSAKIAKTRGMPYYRARALLDLAAVKEENREANRDEAIELLNQMESVIPRAESWLLGDQYDEAVVAPEFDLTAWENENGPVTPYLDHPKG